MSDHGQRPVHRDGARWYRIKTTRLLADLGIVNKVYATNMGSELYLRPAGSAADFATALAAIRSVVSTADGKAIFVVTERPAGEALVTVNSELPDSDTTAYVGTHVMHRSDLLDATERISGEHTETAIVLMVGPDIAKGVSIPRGSVLDVAPTVLALLGLPVARDMDGKILDAAFRPGVVDRLALAYVDSYGTPDAVRRIDDGIGGRKLEQLKALGYVE
jgi:hypothetical protein